MTTFRFLYSRIHFDGFNAAVNHGSSIQMLRNLSSNFERYMFIVYMCFNNLFDFHVIEEKNIIRCNKTRHDHIAN